MKFTFNTGRQYTAAGQIIRVEVEYLGEWDANDTADARVWFYDESRGIAGSFDTYCFTTDRPLDIQRSVLAAYDSSKYRTESLPSTGGAR
jgi:hypothetical protein